MRHQRALTAGALIGLFAVLASAGQALGAPPNRMLGPSYPALIDTHGNGKPTPGSDVPAVPTRSGSVVSIGNPWDTCSGGNTNNDFTLTGKDDAGKYRGSNGARKDGGSQGASITGFDSSSKPTTFAGTYTRKQGTATYVGSGTGGFTFGSGPVPTGFQLSVVTSQTTNISSGFLLSDTDGDGNADYVSVPWATQSLLGVKPFPRTCEVPGAGTGNPQIWIPLADSNGDGIPDSIIFDLDGNGQADPDLYPAGPPLVASPCVYAIDPTSKTAPAAGETNSFALTTGNASCIWNATSNAAWITLPVATGTGNSTISYVVAPNLTTSPRTGTISVSGQTFTVTQAALSCTFTFNPTSINVPATAGSYSSALTASNPACAWTATSGSPSWLTVTAPASGTGSATVNVAVAANSDFSSRTGTVTAGGATFTVVQAAAVPPQVIPTLSEWGLAALGLALALAGWALLRRGGLGV